MWHAAVTTWIEPDGWRLYQKGRHLGVNETLFTTLASLLRSAVIPVIPFGSRETHL